MCTTDQATYCDQIAGRSMDAINALHKRNESGGLPISEILTAANTMARDLRAYLRVLSEDRDAADEESTLERVTFAAISVTDLLASCVNGLLQQPVKTVRDPEADRDRDELEFFRNGVAWVLKNAADARAGDSVMPDGTRWQSKRRKTRTGGA